MKIEAFHLVISKANFELSQPPLVGTTDFEHVHLWEQNGFVQDITKRFQPKLNFTRNPVQLVRMPLVK